MDESTACTHSGREMTGSLPSTPRQLFAGAVTGAGRAQSRLHFSLGCPGGSTQLDTGVGGSGGAGLTLQQSPQGPVSTQTLGPESGCCKHSKVKGAADRGLGGWRLEDAR